MRPLLPSLPLLLLLALMGAGCADMTSSPGGNGPDDYAETLGDDDDDATVGDDDGEASGDDDDDDAGGSLPGAENVVLRTRPQPEARDFHYLDCLTVEFSDAYGDVPYEVTLATALITALARPGDPVAVLAVLRSSLVGASDAEIARYLARQGDLDYRAAEGPAGPGAAASDGGAGGDALAG